MSLEHSPARGSKHAAAAREWPLLLKIEAVERELSLTRRGVYDLIHSGELDLVKLGPHASRITSESMLRLANERTLPGPLPTNLIRKTSAPREQEQAAPPP